MSDAQQLSAALKAEGNALFAKKEWSEAHSKYTQAIALDDKNAVLYANRSACCLSMGQYLDAASDGKRAIEHDPTYAKGWARVASANDALKQYLTSVDAWQRALGALPVENLSAAELKQKAQYEAGLKSARAALTAAQASPGHAGISMDSSARGKFPWDVARAMRPELQRQGMAKAASSAWVILGAIQEFEEGVSSMKQIKKVPYNGQQALVGRLGAIQDIVSAILRDERVFHIDDPKWLLMYNDQVIMEASQSRAWTDGGPEHVKQEALKRQRQEGWAAVRPAIGLTIRMWILRGFLQGGLKQDHHIAVEFYDRAIEVLNWGRQVWRGVRAEDRGTVFEASFVRGVRHLRIEAYMQAYAKGNASFSLEHILEEADDIIREIDANPLPSATEYDPGFVSSFTVYPRARALTMRAFYHAQLAQRLHREKDAKAGAHFALAAGSYAEAALVYPDDDEMHVWFLHNALHQLWASSAPLRVTLPTMKRIREAMPKMGTLWAQSALAREGRDELLQQDLDAERKALRLIEEGKVGLDGFVGPGGEL